MVFPPFYGDLTVSHKAFEGMPCLKKGEETMSAPEDVLYYQGKPVTDMTKEELIDALRWADRQIKQMREQHAHDLHVLTGKY